MENSRDKKVETLVFTDSNKDGSDDGNDKEYKADYGKQIKIQTVFATNISK